MKKITTAALALMFIGSVAIAQDKKMEPKKEMKAEKKEMKAGKKEMKGKEKKADKKEMKADKKMK
jgi:hypothetical protein